MDRARLVGLYVHIPFCSVKCFYCDFAAFSGQGRSVARYLAALAGEAKLTTGPRPETLYIGGGTPSELSVDEIAELFRVIRKAYPDSNWRESTFEANPESLTPQKLDLLAREGVTRLSLGLQTHDDGLLKSIGRRHTATDFLNVYREARRMEAFAINVDLMYGLPGQTLKSLEESLAAVLQLRPEHLSLYGLQVEDRTLFGRRGIEPDEDLGREMFETGLALIDRAGYRHYELSNFALPGRESIHNMIYWSDGEYLGLGCGAASHLGGVRSTNAERLGDYCGMVERGQRPTAEWERPQGREKLGEKAFLGLRLLEGLELTPELETQFSGQWESLTRRGLVLREGRRVRLSREGVFLANQAFSEFVPPYPESERISLSDSGLDAPASSPEPEAAP